MAINGVNSGYLFVQQQAPRNRQELTKKSDFKDYVIFEENKYPYINKKPKHDKAKTTATVLGLATAAILAIVFRGKIKAGAVKVVNVVKPYVTAAITKGKNLVKKGYNVVKPYVEKGINYVKPYVQKGVTFVKNVGKKIVNFFK